MSISSSLVPLFLVVAIVSAAAVFVPTAGGATVHVINALPQGSAQLNVGCNSASPGKVALAVGAELKFTPKLANVVDLCDAIWTRLFSSWHALEPARDANRQDLYWQVREDGFYLGYDKSSWAKKETWQTE